MTGEKGKVVFENGSEEFIREGAPFQYGIYGRLSEGARAGFDMAIS